jgi:tetratricopeptide (TPR) repeat protein
MKQNELLSCLEKRDLLNQSAASVETLLEWGELYLDAGLVHDALDFYEKAGAKEPLVKFVELAKAEGDALLLQRASTLLGGEPAGDEWRAVAAQAEQLGKFLFALKAYQRAGADEQVERMRNLLQSGSEQGALH